MTPRLVISLEIFMSMPAILTDGMQGRCEDTGEYPE